MSVGGFGLLGVLMMEYSVGGVVRSLKRDAEVIRTSFDFFTRECDDL